MNKTLDVIFIIAGSVALMGSFFLVYGIVIFDSSLNEFLALDPAGAANLGLDVDASKQVVQQTKGILTLAIIWCIFVMVASVGLIWHSLTDLRKKK